MNPNIHEAVDVTDAVTMLETPWPKTRSEVELVCESLFDVGRRAGIRAEKARLRKIADILRAHESSTSQTIATLLDSWIDVDGFEEAQQAARAEYEDPVTTIRERLTENARQRDGLR